MSQTITTAIAGLHTYASDISAVPPGSLKVANNVSISRTNVAEPRRGYNLLTYGLPALSDRPKKLVFWNDALLCHYGSLFAYYDAASGFASRGALTAPANANAIRTVASQNKNLYITSNAGVRKMDALTANIYASGLPGSSMIDLSLAGAGTALVNSSYAAYRSLILRKDANAVSIYSGVSGSYQILNSAGSTQNVTARCYLPVGLDTSCAIQLYKAVSTVVTVTDERGLVYETPITAAHITAGYVDITDVAPDGTAGAIIYTATSQGGMLSNNTVPPLASDIAEYKKCMFFADTDSPERLKFALITVGGTGLVANDTITITLGDTAEVYTAKATETVASKEFALGSSGSTSQILDVTIKSFIKVVNLASAIMTATDATTDVTKDIPGKVLIESKTLGTASFVVKSSRATAFQPNLTTTATVNTTSASDRRRNGLMYSKPGELEAVPLLNFVTVGASDDPIKRVISHRDGLFIFKARDGVFVLRGETAATWVVTPIDSTQKILAPESLCVVNNLIYGLFEAGICEVSDTGVNIISIPIKDKLQSLLGAPLANVKARAFGIANDGDGKYILCIPTSADDTSTVLEIVYDVFGQTFTTWDLPLACGGVNPADAKLYLGQGTSSFVKQERKAFDYTDYADYVATGTVTSYSGTTVYCTGISAMQVGDLLSQGTNAVGYIESTQAAAGYVVIDSEQAWTLNTADVVHLSAINCSIQFNPEVAGNPAGIKHFYECLLLFKQAFQKSATVYFSSDINPGEASIAITSASGNGAFGQFSFGDEVFGGDQANSPQRIGVPRGHARCSLLSVRFEHRIAYSDFQLTGVSLPFNPTSTRTVR